MQFSVCNLTIFYSIGEWNISFQGCTLRDLIPYCWTSMFCGPSLIFIAYASVTVFGLTRRPIPARVSECRFRAAGCPFKPRQRVKCPGFLLPAHMWARAGHLGRLCVTVCTGSWPPLGLLPSLVPPFVCSVSVLVVFLLDFNLIPCIVPLFLIHSVWRMSKNIYFKYVLLVYHSHLNSVSGCLFVCFCYTFKNPSLNPVL